MVEVVTDWEMYRCTSTLSATKFMRELVVDRAPGVNKKDPTTGGLNANASKFPLRLGR